MWRKSRETAPYAVLFAIPLLALAGSAVAQNSETPPNPPADKPERGNCLPANIPGSPKQELRYKAYAGPARPDSEVAILYLRRNGGCASKPCPPPGILAVNYIDGIRDVAILNWDGTLREGCKAHRHNYGPARMFDVNCKHRFNAVELLPGTHTLSFAADAALSPHWGFSAAKTLTVEAGKKYRVELVENNSYANTTYNVAYGSSVTTLHIWLSVVISEIKPDEEQR